MRDARDESLLTRLQAGDEQALAELADAYPHRLSGGQRQRVSIARAMVLEPDYLVADEPVSMIDASSRAEILDLLDELQEARQLTYLYITHDLASARHFAERIAVMYAGRIVELAASAELVAEPRHPYTKALLAAVPIPDPRANAEREPLVLEGDVPSPANPPSACRFHTRCPYATEICSEVEPQLVDHGGGPWAACPHPLNVSETEISGAKKDPSSPASAGDLLPEQTPSAA